MLLAEPLAQLAGSASRESEAPEAAQSWLVQAEPVRLREAKPGAQSVLSAVPTSSDRALTGARKQAGRHHAARDTVWPTRLAACEAGMG